MNSMFEFKKNLTHHLAWLMVAVIFPLSGVASQFVLCVSEKGESTLELSLMGQCQVSHPGEEEHKHPVPRETFFSTSSKIECGQCIDVAVTSAIVKDRKLRYRNRFFIKLIQPTDGLFKSAFRAMNRFSGYTAHFKRKSTPQSERNLCSTILLL